MQEVVVVIPIYKNRLTQFEAISLHQVLRILSHCPKCIIIPSGLDISKIEHDETCSVEEFPSEFFSSISQYSRLLVSSQFYSRFANFKFMLIYQLDAFVFKDQLNEFCRLEYDYIGAPWFRWTSMYKFSHNFVGNGGLCLRHVLRTKQVLEEHRAFVEAQYLPIANLVGEDTLFSYFGHHKEFDYKVAPLSIAKRFALETDFHKTYQHFPAQLPFGCHAWYKRDFLVWKPYIEKFGYKFDSEDERTVSSATTLQMRLGVVVPYIMKKIDGKAIAQIAGKAFKETIHGDSFSVWGVGKDGIRCLQWLRILDVKVKKLYDSNVKIYNGISVHHPRGLENSSENLLLITSRRYGKDMYREGKKYSDTMLFFDFDEFLLCIWKSICRCIIERQLEKCR